ncbi:SWIM zinc finger family protein [Sphaerotilaceae bacterium SBD11-9]
MSDTPDKALLAALSDAALKRASNPAIFQRGQGYAQSDAVHAIEEETGQMPAARATVMGTQPYEAEVWVDEGEVGGQCDCPNAEDGWFCKHQVALALVWRGRLGGEVPAPDAAASKKVAAAAATGAKRARTIEDRREALAEFLRGQDAHVLAQRLLDMADRDGAVERELQQWRKLSDLRRGAASLTELKALATQILAPGRDFLDWRQTSAFAQRAADVPPLLAQTRARSAEDALTLGQHALRRAWAAMEQADDSGGGIGELVRAIGDEWVEALRAVGARPVAFGESYLQLLLDDPITSFDTDAVEAAMGDAARARFTRCLAERWRVAKDAVLAARAAHAAKVAEARRLRRREPYYDRNDERPAGLFMLEHLHLAHLEADGDIDGALAVLREDLPDPVAYAAVTAFLERHGRLREAFANAAAALKAFPDDERLQVDMLRCCERDGWVEEALALRRLRFERWPSFEGYRDLLRAGAAAGRDAEALRAELQAWLVAREARAAPHIRARTGEAGTDVTLRAEVLCMEQRWGEALAIVQRPARCQPGTLRTLARHLGANHLAQRIELLRRVLAQAMQTASSPYRGELQLVEEICGLLDPVPRLAWLASLRAEFKAKRNFVAGLPVR